MPYEKEEDERSEINWDRFSGEGVLIIIRMVKNLTLISSLLACIHTLSPLCGPLSL